MKEAMGAGLGSFIGLLLFELFSPLGPSLEGVARAVLMGIFVVLVAMLFDERARRRSRGSA